MTRMARQKRMALFAKWHVWLGWLVGLPILMWTVTGLVMVWHPIEYVRGNHLRIDSQLTLLPAGNPAPTAFRADGSQRYTEMRAAMQRGLRAQTAQSFCHSLRRVQSPLQAA